MVCLWDVIKCLPGCFCSDEEKARFKKTSLPVKAKRQCTIRDKFKIVHHTVGVLEYSTVKEVCGLGQSYFYEEV